MYTSDAQVSVKNNTQIPGPAIYTGNPDITPLHPSRPWSKPLTHSPPTPPQPKHTHVQHSTCSHRIGNAQTQSSHPSLPTLPRAKHIHISHTPPTPLIPGPKISAYSWWNCQATHNRLPIEINYYPDSLLFISAGFLPRVSSQRLN